MKIRVDYTWHRNRYDYSNVIDFVILETKNESKSSVLEALRNYFANWSGKGYATVHGIDASYSNQQKHCEIKQTKFKFNNTKSKN